MQANRRAEKRAPPAERLAANKDRLVRQFVVKLSEALPSAKGLEDSALADSFPEFLDQLCARFQKTEDSGPLRKIEGLSKDHAITRLGVTGYSLVQVLTEYHILRRLIVDLLAESGEFSHEERRTVNEAIDRGIAYAGQSFLDEWNRQRQQVTDLLAAEIVLRERLLHALGHDLRTPLTAARAQVELTLRVAATDANVVKLQQGALGALDRMNRMIESLLDVGKLRAGSSFPITLSRTHLGDLVHQVVQEFQVQHGERFAEEREDVIIRCDPIGVQRCLENLLSNALKYGAPDSIIQITVREMKDWATISVYNHGRPIPPETRARMYDPFRQGDEPSQHKEGWGVGQFVVKSIVEAHHGRIEVETSEKIGGTRFTLCAEVWTRVDMTLSVGAVSTYCV